MKRGLRRLAHYKRKHRQELKEIKKSLLSYLKVLFWLWYRTDKWTGYKKGNWRVLKFCDVEILKLKFRCYKQVIDAWDIDIKKILLSAIWW